MTSIDRELKFDFLSELYAQEDSRACLLAEYPSSNSTETIFQNRNRFIIHDPFPPPARSLIKVLGPHHLMCCWGCSIPVCSEIGPAEKLTQHWGRMFGDAGVPDWIPFDVDNPKKSDHRFITLFPHESLSAEQQVVDPETNYALHSKEVIEQIDCPQAKVLNEIQSPCVVKLSHGYAGLGNFFIRDDRDAAAMRVQLSSQWPSATLVVNELLTDISGDYGIQFFLRRDGDVVWMGFTEQHFDSNTRWCGGSFSAHLQTELFGHFESFVVATAAHLHKQKYFGVIGIDIVRTKSDQFFLVDVNPRLTGISPFLMASRIFAREGFDEGIYQASGQFTGSLDQLIDKAEQHTNARILVLSAFEDLESNTTLCHLSASSKSQSINRSALESIVS